MAKSGKQSKEQKETVERVMHEFKHGELRIRGSGPKVRNPKQAIAIALREAGASDQETPAKNRENLRKTKSKERRGATAAKAGSKKASRAGDRTASPRERLGQRARTGGAKTRAELYAEARRRDIPGRSRMSKGELERALR
jgi:hypothetical protein